MKRVTLIMLVMGMAGLLTLPIVSGCGMSREDAIRYAEEGEAAIAQVTQTVERLKEQKESIDKEIATLPEGDYKESLQKYSTELDKAIEQGESYLSVAYKEVALLRQRIAAATDDLGAIEAAGQTITTFLPPPWGTVASVGLGLVIGLIRSNRLKTTAKRVIATIDPHVSIPDGPEKNKVVSEQGYAGNKLVDQAQGKVADWLPF